GQLRVPPIRFAETSGAPPLPTSSAVAPIVESSRLSSSVVPLTSARPVTVVCSSTTDFAPVAESGPLIVASTAYSEAPGLTVTPPLTVDPGARQVTPDVTTSGPACCPDTVLAHAGGGAASSSSSAIVVEASPVFFVTSSRYRLNRPGCATVNARVCSRHRKVSSVRWSTVVHRVPS